MPSTGRGEYVRLTRNAQLRRRARVVAGREADRVPELALRQRRDLGDGQRRQPARSGSRTTGLRRPAQLVRRRQADHVEQRPRRQTGVCDDERRRQRPAPRDEAATTTALPDVLARRQAHRLHELGRARTTSRSSTRTARGEHRHHREQPRGPDPRLGAERQEDRLPERARRQQRDLRDEHERLRQKRLTHNPDFDGGPDFSPDGKRIVYGSYRNGNTATSTSCRPTAGGRPG